MLADVIARYHRLKGEEVFFLTGVDQHGQKVQQSAAKQGMEPQAFVDEITAKFLALWQKLGVRYDGWAATTDPAHKAQVRAILQRLWDDQDPATGSSRWIYKDARGGYYSVRQEQFLTEKERGPDGQFGPEWGEVEFREEENYYFCLEPYRQWLLDLIDARAAASRPFVLPEFRQSELRNAVEKIAGDLCISRPKARLAWGIELPFDADYVDLRVVRRAGELHHLCAGLRSRRGPSAGGISLVVAHSRPRHRQGHPHSGARRLLAESCCTRWGLPTTRFRRSSSTVGGISAASS